MRKFLLTTASVAALLASSPALAAGPNNTSTVDQSGTAQAVIFHQDGVNDTSSVVQKGKNSTTTIKQNGIVGGSSSVDQNGDGNTADVTQSDDGSANAGGTLIINPSVTIA